jgi:hypothetical protein
MTSLLGHEEAFICTPPPVTIVTVAKRATGETDVCPRSGGVARGATE